MAGPGRIAAQTGIGAMALFIFLSVLTGSVANAAGFLFIAVVCTAGVGLGILGAVAFVMGWLVWEFGVGVRSAYELAARSGGSA